ncbi:MAG: hypothetical protein R3E86_03265 [Pseudomonadales bacterium]
MFRKRKASGGSHKFPTHTVRLFHAVTIQADPAKACDSALALAGKRFLSDDAPLLPLPDCTCALSCRCRYKHLSDRRTEPRRESDVGMPVRTVADERRGGPGRRITDA